MQTVLCHESGGHGFHEMYATAMHSVLSLHFVGGLVDKPDFAPLQYPIPWPPPDIPSYPRHSLSSVPVLGWPFRYFRWLHHWSLHQKNVLTPIDTCIVDQLRERPAKGPWPKAAEEKLLAEIVSRTVAFWKGLANPVALHPHDPVPLLFWGPFDDLTPMDVIEGARKSLKRVIPHQLILAAWKECWTIERFIDEIIRISPSDSSSGRIG